VTHPTPGTASDQARLGKFALQIGVVDWSRDQTGAAEQGLHDQHRDQQLPGKCLDLRAYDARVEEIF